MSEDIIESIDGALRDWETSDDAMRWVPPEDRKPKDARYVPTLREVGHGIILDETTECVAPPLLSTHRYCSCGDFWVSRVRAAPS